MRAGRYMDCGWRLWRRAAFTALSAAASASAELAMEDAFGVRGISCTILCAGMSFRYTYLSGWLHLRRWVQDVAVLVLPDERSRGARG